MNVHTWTPDAVHRACNSGCTGMLNLPSYLLCLASFLHRKSELLALQAVERSSDHPAHITTLEIMVIEMPECSIPYGPFVCAKA